MMWTDKAFGIWMGHAGEEAQVFTQDDPAIDTRALERAQRLAIARREVMAPEGSTADRQPRESQPERLAA